MQILKLIAIKHQALKLIETSENTKTVEEAMDIFDQVIEKLRKVN